MYNSRKYDRLDSWLSAKKTLGKNLKLEKKLKTQGKP